MDSPSRRLIFFLMLGLSLLAPSLGHAATSCTSSGTSYFGVEAYAAPQEPNREGKYFYRWAPLQCSNKQVVRWNTEQSGWYYPEDLLAVVKQANPNMTRIFTNRCKTHVLVIHDLYTGTLDQVSMSNYKGKKQTYFDVFAGPVFYERPVDRLPCPAMPGLGNPDLPAACPVQSASRHPTSAGAPSSSVFDPVNVSNGNSYQTEVDYPGLPGTQLHFARYYNSKAFGWSHSYSARLQVSSSKILLIEADGRESLFTLSNGVVSGTPTERGQLVQTASGWRYDNLRDEHLHFNLAGQLTRIDRANGSHEELSYSDSQITIMDSLNRAITLTLNSAKRISTLSTPISQVTYAYNTAGRLLRVTRAQGGQSVSRLYHYEDTREGGWLTGITDERNIRYVTWAFDAQGRVIRNELNGGADRSLLTYNANGSTTVTNSLGKQTTYSFQTIDGIKRITSLSGAASANCPNSNSTFTYDSRGQIKSRTDNKGYVTTFEYDARGLEQSRTDAAGTPQARTILTEWHPTLYKPTRITEPGRVLQFEYDVQGNQLRQTITEL